MADLSGRRSPLDPPDRRGQGPREDRDADRLRRARRRACSTRPGIDVLLVGDSVEMTVYGEPNTLSATMDAMVRHARGRRRARRSARSSSATCRSSPTRSSPRRAVENAGRFLAEAGCAAVKVEGGKRILPAVEAILAADIPVMGHVGLTPQSYRKFGGFKVQGREADSAREILEDAQALARGGLLRDRPRVRARSRSRPRSRGRSRSRRSASAPAPRLRRTGPRLPRRHGPDARPAPEVRPALRGPADRDRGRRARLHARTSRSGSFPDRGGVVHGAANARACLTTRLVALNTVSRRPGPARRRRPGAGGRQADRASSRRWARSTRGISRSCAWRAPMRPSSSSRSSSTRCSSGRTRTSPATRGAKAEDARLARARGRRPALPAGRRDASTRRTSRPRVEVGGVSEGGEGARAARALPRRRDRRREALPAGPPRRRRLRPKGPAAGRRRPPHDPRPRLSDPARRRRDGPRAGRPRAVLAQRLPLARGAAAAPPISRRALFAARGAARPREPRRRTLEAEALRQLEAAGLAVDYVEVVDADTMSPGRPTVRPGVGSRRRRPAREDAADRQRFPP